MGDYFTKEHTQLWLDSVKEKSYYELKVPTGTYSSNASIAKELEEAINDDSALKTAGKTVNVLWDGNNYQIVSNSSLTSASVNVTTITTALDNHLKFSSSTL